MFHFFIIGYDSYTYDWAFRILKFWKSTHISMLPMEFKDENFVEHTQSHEDGSNQSRNEEDMNFKKKGVILLKNILFIHFVTFEHTFATLQTIQCYQCHIPYPICKRFQTHNHAIFYYSCMFVCGSN